MEPINTNTAKGAFEQAQRFEKSERFEEAIRFYNEIKNKHPYSKYAIRAELRIADIYFKREDFIEAENAYKLFKEFHPRHHKIDYVTFQIGMSIFKQLPSSIDRDLGIANNAILYFEQVVNSYPNSDYAGSAGDHKIRCLQKLARKESYIANFYLKREKYQSALARFEQMLKKYSGIGLDARALFGASKSAYHLKQLNKARTYYNQLQTHYAKSKWSRKAKIELGELL